MRPSPQSYAPPRRSRMLTNWRLLLFALVAAAVQVWPTPARLEPARWTTSPPSDGSPALIMTTVIPAPPEAVTMRGYMQYLVATNQFSGAVLVARKGQVLLNAGYGMANAAEHRANTPQTRFRLASLSKQFTAMAIMILQAHGKLSVDDPVCHYINPCPPAWQPLIIAQLLNHTSGLQNYTDFDDFAATMDQATAPAALLSRFRALPLQFAPGSAYHYTNTGYIVAGIIIEAVSGQSYADFLHDAIFAPLGMRDTGYDQGNTGRARGYVGPGALGSTIESTTLFAAGGLYSSAEDMYRWDQSLYTSTLVPDAMRDRIFTPNMAGYGFGWTIRAIDGHPVVSHPGLMSGAATFIVRMPADRISVVVLSNFEYAPVQDMADHLARLALP